MDLFKIFSEIEKIDGEVYERFDTRRRAFKHLAGLGKTVTAATMPALLSTMFTKAYGQAATLTDDMKAVLNLALQLEYLEFYFYDTALASGVVPAADRPAITIIRDDERGHINALRTVLGVTGTTELFQATDFDYTADGQLAPFTKASEFYGTAQSFVDTGVRAYKGGAPKLMANKDVLTAALNIHSVEARHSSHIRMVRRRLMTDGTLGTTDVPGEVAGGTGNMKPKSWVSLQENGGPKPTLTAPVYGPGTTTDFPAEDNVAQGGINVQTTTGYPTVPALTLTNALKQAAASEAFDEPLDAARVKDIARHFISPAGAAKNLFA